MTAQQNRIKCELPCALTDEEIQSRGRMPTPYPGLDQFHRAARNLERPVDLARREAKDQLR